ncbi:Csa1 family protein [Staphylococcus aureus]
MVLYINRNTRTAKGYFLISETTEDKKTNIIIIKIKNTLSRWNIIKLFQRSP